MRPLVRDHLTLLRESLLAKVALERLLPGVYEQVTIQRDLLGESKTESLLNHNVHVYKNVDVNVSGLLFVARRTLVGFVADVYSIVGEEGVLLRETFVADVASVRSFAGVCLHVRKVFAWCSEYFWTVAAGYQFLAGVQSQVHRQTALLRILLAADETGKSVTHKNVH